MRHLPLALAVLLCGCSGQVDVSADSAGSTSGTTASTSAGAGGAGGMTVTGAGGAGQGGGGAGGGEVTTSSAGGGPACPGVIDVDIDGNGEGPTLPLAFNCLSGAPSPGAIGALGYLGEGGTKALFLFGCAAPGELGAPADLYVWADLTGPGMTQVGHVELTFSGKAQPVSDEMALVIDGFGPVGGMITGTLSFAVTNADGTTMPLSAHIAVCRREDFPPAP